MVSALTRPAGGRSQALPWIRVSPETSRGLPPGAVAICRRFSSGGCHQAYRPPWAIGVDALGARNGPDCSLRWGRQLDVVPSRCPRSFAQSSVPGWSYQPMGPSGASPPHVLSRSLSAGRETRGGAPALRAWRPGPVPSHASEPLTASRQHGRPDPRRDATRRAHAASFFRACSAPWAAGCPLFCACAEPDAASK